MSDLTTFKTCASMFINIFPSFIDKVNFLKEFNENKDCIKTKAEYAPILECVKIMTENAREPESRKNQQHVLMPILAKAQKCQTKNELYAYFEVDDFSFALFCLTYVTFFVEENKNERVDEIHKHVTKLLTDVVNLLINE